MAKVTLSTGREVDTDKIQRSNGRGGYVEVQFKTGDADKTDDINVSREDFDRIEAARNSKEQAAQA